jgi:hypothetical protein
VIYVIQPDTFAAPFKVGSSDDPERRLAQLQTAHHQDLHLTAVFPGGIVRERQIHQLLSPLRLRGEWYRSDHPAGREFIHWAHHQEYLYWAEQEAAAGDPGARPLREVRAEIRRTRFGRTLKWTRAAGWCACWKETRRMSERQAYTITILPNSGRERKMVMAASLTEALDAVTRRLDGEPWSDGPNPWVLTFHIARGDVGEFDHAGCVKRMKDDLALQEYHADQARMEVPDARP